MVDIVFGGLVVCVRWLLEMASDYRSLVGLNGWIAIGKALLVWKRARPVIYVLSTVRRSVPVTLDDVS